MIADPTRLVPRASASGPEDGTDAAAIVRAGLERAASVLESQGLPVPPIRGKLIRPTIAYALVPADRRAELDDRFWLGALAIQMVHEASLLHDDILDGAEERRGRPTACSEHGVATALVQGDHYLTASYRAAVWTRSPAFLERFIMSVERTVAGEVLQGRTVGDRIDLDTYFDAILGKSGELLRASASLGAHLLGLDRVDDRGLLGLQLGALYQQVDDLLDFCPAADTGKEGLKDFSQRKWTWVFEMADADAWDAPEDEMLRRLFTPGPSGVSPAQRSIVYLEVRRTAILRRMNELVPGASLVEEIVDGWIEAARSGVERQTREVVRASGPRSESVAAGQGPLDSRPSAEAWVLGAAARLPDRAAWGRCFGSHAKTFSLAARLFPPAERLRVEALYAYCRFTDDLVDAVGDEVDPEELAARLDVWRDLSRRAFDEGASDIPLLDAVMADAVRADVDWLYPDALLEGVGMDLAPRRYADWKELGRYTFCVAGAVGGWMTHLFGIRDPDTVARAHALGHAMQLTNILRDVGEDLELGRVYLPQQLLDRYGLDVDQLSAWQRSTEPLPERYSAAMRELIATAEERYGAALPGIRRLPPAFRRPVAVAASAYRGIHAEVRRNGYDTLRRRAHTSLVRKVLLGATGLARARGGDGEVRAAEQGLAT
ncbi:MAG: squalene/phytoene synthase family protein [Gemmatimonadetes bacterium]|nr:squalene/phytoene synthase family protein [Gemmatimonadota bacterium]